MIFDYWTSHFPQTTQIYVTTASGDGFFNLYSKNLVFIWILQNKFNKYQVFCLMSKLKTNLTFQI